MLGKCLSAGTVLIVVLKVWNAICFGESELKTSEIRTTVNSCLDLYVVGDGKITPWGTVHFLAKGVRPSRPGDGSKHFHKRLLGLAARGYKATVVGDRLMATGPSGSPVITIPCQELKYVSRHRMVMVRKNGYLQDTEQLTLSNTVLINDKLEKEEEQYKAKLWAAIDRAENGLKPSMFDNSFFLKVSGALAGRELFMLEFNFGISKEDFKVLTPDGQRVKFSARRPLAFAKWGEKPPPAGAGSSDISR